MKNPILFGDYKNALDLGEPRLHEDIEDYATAQVTDMFLFALTE